MNNIRTVFFGMLKRLKYALIIALLVGAGSIVKSNMVYTLCKHMVYMLSITNEHKK